MSSAFVREPDDHQGMQWLHQVPLTLDALGNYLTRENHGGFIRLKRTYFHPELNKEVHQMSDGLTYYVNEKGQWDVL